MIKQIEHPNIFIFKFPYNLTNFFKNHLFNNIVVNQDAISTYSNKGGEKFGIYHFNEIAFTNKP